MDGGHGAATYLRSARDQRRGDAAQLCNFNYSVKASIVRGMRLSDWQTSPGSAIEHSGPSRYSNTASTENMKFAVLQFFSWPERRVELGTVYQRALDRVRIMDGSGYDAVWLAEHHFSAYSVCPSVHVMGMHVADITRNLRIGTGVSLAAFHHPLRLAEEVALLDHLSGGRVNWGAGRGFDKTEMAAFGVTAEDSYDRFHENVNVVLQAWSSDRLTFHGEFNRFEDVEVLPKPLQNPLPTWIASSSPDAIAWSARQGHAFLMDPHSSHE